MFHFQHVYTWGRFELEKPVWHGTQVLCFIRWSFMWPVLTKGGIRHELRGRAMCRARTFISCQCDCVECWKTVHCQQVSFSFWTCCCLMSYKGWFVRSRVWQLEPAGWQCAEPQQSCDRARNVKPLRQHDAKAKNLQQRCQFSEEIFWSAWAWQNIGDCKSFEPSWVLTGFLLMSKMGLGRIGRIFVWTQSVNPSWHGLSIQFDVINFHCTAHGMSCGCSGSITLKFSCLALNVVIVRGVGMENFSFTIVLSNRWNW